MRNTTKFALTFTIAVALLYGFGIVGAQKGWFFGVDFAFDDDDIGGFVTSSNGVEAGAWVIAETTDLPAKFAKIVVTDEKGRYVLPDLPFATYDVWVRGYGLVDSAKVKAQPGMMLNLTASPARAPAADELSKSRPQRPQGVERALVLTLWERANPDVALGNTAASDKRNPTINADVPIFSVAGGDSIQMFDRATGTTSEIAMRIRDPQTQSSGNPTDLAQAILDEKGRLWLTVRIRTAANPAFCRRGSQNASAKVFPLERSDRQLAFYDLNAKQFTLIDTCFTTDRMAFDKNGVLWFSAGPTVSDVVGWFDTKKFDATHDAQAAQGWTVIVADTNGSHERDAYVEPGAPVDMTRDKRFRAGFSDVAVSPSDEAVWGSVPGYPGALVRLVPGANPSSTALAEYYEPPFDAAAMAGFGPRGLDVDSNGVVWVSLISGHFASFDRRKCKGPFYGPDATGAQCREGWTLYPFEAPQFEGVADKGSAEGGYSTYVDRFDTFGLGRDVPIATTTISDALVAVVNGAFVTLRVPYPTGFYAKAVDGRIDDAALGWKGKGLWSAFAGQAVQHLEGGKGTTSKVVHFQLRPDPLAH